MSKGLPPDLEALLAKTDKTGSVKFPPRLRSKGKKRVKSPKSGGKKSAKDILAH